MRCRLRFPLFVILGLTAISCSQARKISQLQSKEMTATIVLPSEEDKDLSFDSETFRARRDTLTITDIEGNEVIVMNAVRDEETGEMVAVSQLDAAVIVTRFRNVAERRGKISLEFQLIVPSQMQDKSWQIRLHPDMFILNDSLRLDDIYITGNGYRQSQLRGYQLYEQFLSRIITDSTRLIDKRNLDLFIERNIPELYAFKTDSSLVAWDDFTGVFGVKEEEAIKHYTRRYLIRRNERLLSQRAIRWQKYVKSPIVAEGVRLDTVMVGESGEFIYNYVQEIKTRPRLRKVDIKLSGEIYDQSKCIYTIPQSEPLTFYISSVSSFADKTPRYLTRIVSRNLETSQSSMIDFKVGSSSVDEHLGANGREIAKIKSTLRSLLQSREVELDSITIIASASPDGNLKDNLSLSYRRARGVSDYFSHFIQKTRDSMRLDAGVVLHLDDETKKTYNELGSREINFISHSGGENWDMLKSIVDADTLLTAEQKQILDLAYSEADYDRRESMLRLKDFYPILRECYYPRLRTVKFNFHLHRKGMIKDTIHTTVLDSVYMKGVELLSDHDYEEAIKYLSPYKDFNTALALLALDRNYSALEILEDCPKTAQVNYLLAIIYSRQGKERDAVESYIRSCQLQPSYIHRGNLDPEISMLIKKYNLNQTN